MTRIEVALEASTRRASVAARSLETEEPNEIHSRELDPERAHASDLLPALDGLLGDLGAQPSDVELICVGTGPGSYTGVRVAIALAQGIALAGNRRLCGVPSIEAELYGQLEVGEVGTALRDARGGRFTLGTYLRCETGLEQRSAPVAVPAADLREALGSSFEDLDAPVLLAEPGLLEALTDGGTLPPGWVEARCARVRDLAPAAASAVLELGSARSRTGQAAPLAQVLPLYLAEFVVRPRSR